MKDLNQLGLLPNIHKRLLEQGIKSISDLVNLSRRELMGIPGIGAKSADAVEATLAKLDLSLAVDPYAPYTCTRHARPAWDVSLQSLFLCDKCADDFSEKAFHGTAPEYVSASIEGYCLHCNQHLNNIKLRQWYLCGICGRVVRSIGRSVAADDYLSEWWDTKVKPQFSHLMLTLTDPPELLPHDPSRRREEKEARVDFTCIDQKSRKEIFGIEVKTGRSNIRGTIGSRMGQFQLDQSDCDDILAVVQHKMLPVYLFHVQAIDRADPPTTHYVAVGSWWTDLFSMNKYYKTSRQRPRENRIAAYYDVAMFRELEDFLDHLAAGGPEQLRVRQEIEGIPKLYE